MADWGFKISQEGYDVKTASDKDLVMSSSFNLLKTSATGTSVGATSVAHGLAYIPIFLTSVVQGGNQGACVGNDLTTTCDATNLNLGATTRYYIFYQQGI